MGRHRLHPHPPRGRAGGPRVCHTRLEPQTIAGPRQVCYSHVWASPWTGAPPRCGRATPPSSSSSSESSRPTKLLYTNVQIGYHSLHTCSTWFRNVLWIPHNPGTKRTYYSTTQANPAGIPGQHSQHMVLQQALGQQPPPIQRTLSRLGLPPHPPSPDHPGPTILGSLGMGDHPSASCRRVKSRRSSEPNFVSQPSAAAAPPPLRRLSCGGPPRRAESVRSGVSSEPLTLTL